MDIKKLLNTKAKSLMKSAPQDIQKQVDGFLKEVGDAVKTYNGEADKKVIKIETEFDSLKASIKKSGGKVEERELFILKDQGNVFGTHKSLFRLSVPNVALQCMNPKRIEDGQTPLCSSACAGFSILPDGDVEICNGERRSIVKEEES